MNEEQLFRKILDACFKVHNALGPGLLESIYEECLLYELHKEVDKVEKQKSLPLNYKGIYLKNAYRVDLMVEERIIVEIKSVEKLSDLHFAQILSYLKLSGCKLGLLVNFNVPHLRDGIRRVIN
jgi:GxxExxY protein